MKNFACKLLVVMCVISLLLTGCENAKYKGNNNQNSLELNYSTDMQIMYLCSGGSVGVPMTKSDTGYYYIGRGIRDKRIVIYIDKESKKATPLCSKPNCMHDDIDECDAYVYSSETVAVDTMFGAAGNLIQYYDGCLYLLCGEYDESFINYNTYIMKMNLDGTGREKLTDYFDFHVKYWFIHRGYLYYCTDFQLLRMPMNSLKSESEVVYELERFLPDSSNSFYNAFAYQNYVYCETDERDETVTNGGVTSHAINIDTLEKFELKVNGKFAGAEAFLGDKVIISNADDNGKYYEICDLNGKNGKKFQTQERKDVTAFSGDGTYLYSDNMAQAVKTKSEQIITVLDNNLNQVDTFKLPQIDMMIYNFFAPQDEDFFIFECFNENDEHIIVMADKSQIGSINGEVIQYTELCKLKWATKNSNGIYYTE